MPENDNNTEEKEVLSRSEIRKRKKEEKKDKKKQEFEEFSEDFDKFEDEEAAIKSYKKKQRKRKLLLFVICLLALVTAGAGTYAYLQETHLKDQERIAELQNLYPEVFVDEEKTEIISNLPTRQYEYITELYNMIPNSTEKIEFRRYQNVLDEQYTNQENAKESLTNLKDEGEDYLSVNANQELFDLAFESLEQPFNTDFTTMLRLEVDDLYAEFEFVRDLREEVDSLYDEDGVLNEYQEVYWTVIKDRIDVVQNPTIRNDLESKVTVAFADWEEREEIREIERAEAEEEARRLAEEEAERQAIEAERLAEEERIRAEAQETARREAEERERIREEARQEIEEELRREQEQNNQNQPEEEDTEDDEVVVEIGPNRIGVNDTFKAYRSMGNNNSRNELLSSVRAGYITSGITTFNGNDNKTTYFGGTKGSTFDYMTRGLQRGAVVTVTDSQGDSHRYTMVDVVSTDTNGEDLMGYTGKTASEMVSDGTNEESIIIELVESDNENTEMWYGIKQR